MPAIGAAQANQSRVETALTNIVTLHRPGQDGVATVWDGNKYIQCRLQLDRAFRCEAAGTLMQPSLARVLSPERITKLHTLGRTLDSSFGNYVQIFPSGSPVKDIAERLLQALKDGYEANISDLEVGSDWIKSERCPPRNGPSQNLAGMISDALSMTGFRVHGCSYKPNDEPLPQVRSKADLHPCPWNEGGRRNPAPESRISTARSSPGSWSTRVAGTFSVARRPRARSIAKRNQRRHGRCLREILTAERVAQLHAAGYADPGRAPNYWKNYSLDEFTDRAIAEELLAILYDVYAYSGVPKLEFKTNQN